MGSERQNSIYGRYDDENGLRKLVDIFAESHSPELASELDAHLSLLKSHKWNVKYVALAIKMDWTPDRELGSDYRETIEALLEEKIDSLPDPNLTDSEKAQIFLECLNYFEKEKLLEDMPVSEIKAQLKEFDLF